MFLITFFFLMIRRPPRSTLFPTRRSSDLYLVHGQKVWTSTAQVANKIILLTRTIRYEDCARPTDGITIFYTDLDRKSTRLNSSHQIISYAVFCLKKKKNNRNVREKRRA